MKRSQLSAEFVGDAGQRIFVLAHHPEQFSGNCILVCPPFAEEMNKSRRMMTELAQHLIKEGKGLVIPDLFGTGDSEGDFAEASVTRWMDDLVQTEKWLEEKGWRVESILGIRFGCLLAAYYAESYAKFNPRLVFWQPVLDGRKALDQFLRIRVAASLMADTKETVSGLKAKIANGATVEIAGYAISNRMAKEMEVVNLDNAINKRSSEFHWIEVVRDLNAAVSLPVEKKIEQIRENRKVNFVSVLGDPFWISNEISINHELIDRTVNLLTGAVS